MFDPKLSGDFTFNRPTGGQQSVVGVVAGLANSLFGRGPNDKPREPSADERFAMDYKGFVDSKGAAFSLDRNSTREFAWKYPQHQDKIFSMAENLGVMVNDPIEQTVDKGLEKYASDPEFIMSAARASQLPENQREAYMLNALAVRAQEDSEIQQLERDKTKLAAEGTLEVKRWDTLGNRQRQYADNVVSTILQPVLQNISNGLVEELSPEEMATLGVRYNKIDMNNINAVLADTRAHLVNSNNEAYFNAYGEVIGLPPKEWEERTLAGIDALIDTAKAFDTPTERNSAMNALIESNAISRLDKAGLSTATWMLKNIDPVLTAPLLSSSDTMKRFASVMLGDDGQVDPDGISERVLNVSKADAEAIAKDTMDLIGKGGSNFAIFDTFTQAAKRSGFGVVDGNTFKTLIANSTEWIKKEVATNPEAKTKVQDWFMSDINQTVTAIRRRLPTDAELSYQNGKFTLIRNSTEKNTDVLAGPGLLIPVEEYARMGLPAGISVDGLNSKLNSLKVLGATGQEVIDAIVGPELNPAGVTSDYKPPTRPEPKSNGALGARLGIDFGKVESEYGLPAGFLDRTAFIESRGNPNAKNPNSTAGGLFQQLDANAKQYGVADKFDPIQSTIGAAKFARDNANYLRKNLGREPTGAELYLAHQQGPEGARKLLSNPNALAVDIVGADAVKLNGGKSDMTAGEFAGLWINKYNADRGDYSSDYGVSNPPSTGESFNPEGMTSTAAPVAADVASGASESRPTAPLTPLATPALEAETRAYLESIGALKEEAKQAIANKPMDDSVRALIESLTAALERK